MLLTKHRLCPVCFEGLKDEMSFDLIGPTLVDCRNCGRHSVWPDALQPTHPLGPKWPALGAFAHAVWKRPTDSVIERVWVDDQIATLRPVSATDQVDNLVLFLADRTQPGGSVQVMNTGLRAAVGACTKEGSRWALKAAFEGGYIEGNTIRAMIGDNEIGGPLVLTLKGWQRRAALITEGKGSRHAFMAMSFGDAEATAMFRDHMQPAAEEAGFTLRRADHDGQLPGSIDDAMRVEIRTSRFVVCDLTGGNRGAYWEAGFAEGIGRRVIYVCKADQIDHADKNTRPHFDTAHQFIIPWTADDPADLRRRLKNAIRAAFPDEAQMEDQPTQTRP